MWIPFSKQINSVFESNNRPPVKLAVGAAFGFFLGASLSLQWARDNSETTPLAAYAAIIGGSIALSSALVAIHCLKDVVRRRIARGEPVNSLLRVLLASGFVSLTVGVLLAFATAVALVVALP